jgi:hypothetical protein
VNDYYTDLRARILRHCLWMAETQPKYAEWSAARYEGESNGILVNLEAKVKQEIKRRNKPTGELK